MKDRTEEFKDMLEECIETEMSKNIRDAWLKELRVLEMDSVREIKENYKDISRKVRIVSEDGAVSYLTSAICTIDNIYLRYPRIYPVEGLKSRDLISVLSMSYSGVIYWPTHVCEFHVFDAGNEFIRSLLPYQTEKGRVTDEDHAEQLTKILSASEMASFNLEFVAMNLEKPALRVVDIYRSDEGQDERREAPAPTGELVLVG